MTRRMAIRPVTPKMTAATKASFVMVLAAEAPRMAADMMLTQAKLSNKKPGPK